jgi:hypothetical protein
VLESCVGLRHRCSDVVCGYVRELTDESLAYLVDLRRRADEPMARYLKGNGETIHGVGDAGCGSRGRVFSECR